MLPAAARVYCPGGTRALAQITEMFYELDADKGGTIDMEEACSFFKKQARLASPRTEARARSTRARSLVLTRRVALQLTYTTD